MRPYSRASEGATRPIEALLCWRVAGDPDPHPHVRIFLRNKGGGTFGEIISWGSPATPTPRVREPNVPGPFEIEFLPDVLMAPGADGPATRKPAVCSRGQERFDEHWQSPCGAGDDANGQLWEHPGIHDRYPVICACGAAAGVRWIWQSTASDVSLPSIIAQMFLFTDILVESFYRLERLRACTLAGVRYAREM